MRVDLTPRRPAALIVLFAVVLALLAAACSPLTGASSTGRPTPTTTAFMLSPGQPGPGAPGQPSTSIRPLSSSEASSPTPSSEPAGSVSSPSTSAPLPEGTVPILYYHRVEAPPAGFYSLSSAAQKRFIDYDCVPAAFAAQLDWLQSNGYTAVLPRDLAALWDAGRPLPPRPVILTFDDGTADWVRTILPMLRARGMVAEFYVTLDAVSAGAITWDDLEALADAGNGIGAHDVHHVQLAMLGATHPAASAATMWYEVSEARRIIGAHLGTPPDSMAYVGGGFDATLESLAKKAGYTTARTIKRGIEQVPSLRFELKVVRIGPFDDVVDVVSGELVPGLPTFTARMAGVSDLAPQPAPSPAPGG